MPAIELDGLTKDYGEVLAADDLSFTVEAGEIFGYLGPNGAGKTTTIRMLLGFIAPTAGAATVLGHDVRDRSALVEAKRRIGYLSDEPGFDEQATGREVIDFHASVKGDERSDALLEAFDPPLDRPVREYSRGNVQKLGIVTTFMHDPDLVILDEPTSGLDPLMKQRFSEFLRAEQDRDVTVFFSSHVLSEVRRLCDRVGILRDGRLVTIEPIETLLRRSGKVVRIHSAAPIPVDVLDLDGVHDLDVGSAATGPTSVDSAAAESASLESSATDPTSATDPMSATDPTSAADPTSPDEQMDTDEQTNTHEQTNSHESTPDRGPADRETETRTDSVETFTECAFTFTGDINALLDRLPRRELIDLSIEEAPLEDVFMRFYGGEDDV